MKTKSSLERMLEQPNAAELIGSSSLMHFSTEMSLRQFQRLDEMSRKQIETLQPSSSKKPRKSELSLIHMNTDVSIYDGWKTEGDANVN